MIEDGVSGFLYSTDAVDMIAVRGIELLTKDVLRSRIASAAATREGERFCADVVVPEYEACYSSLAFRAEAAEYEWLTHALAVMEGDFDERAGRVI